MQKVEKKENIKRITFNKILKCGNFKEIPRILIVLSMNKILQVYFQAYSGILHTFPRFFSFLFGSFRDALCETIPNSMSCEKSSG